jgi:hypothetical protein
MKQREMLFVIRKPHSFVKITNSVLSFNANFTTHENKIGNAVSIPKPNPTAE